MPVKGWKKIQPGETLPAKGMLVPVRARRMLEGCEKYDQLARAETDSSPAVVETRG
jgi:hypothetical protein